MKDGLARMQQWKEIDEIGFLRSHVGGAANVFGCSTTVGGSRAGELHEKNKEEPEVSALDDSVFEGVNGNDEGGKSEEGRKDGAGGLV